MTQPNKTEKLESLRQRRAAAAESLKNLDRRIARLEREIREDAEREALALIRERGLTAAQLAALLAQKANPGEAG